MRFGVSAVPSCDAFFFLNLTPRLLLLRPRWLSFFLSTRRYHALAELYKDQGDLGGARAQYRLALSKDRGFVPTFHAWGQLELRAGNHALALTLLERGLQCEPLNTRLLFATAVLKASRFNRPGDALELLDRGLRNPTGSGNRVARNRGLKGSPPSTQRRQGGQGGSLFTGSGGGAAAAAAGSSEGGSGGHARPPPLS